MRRSRVWMPRDIYYYFGALNRASVCYHWREIVIFAVVCFRRPICSECCLLPPMPCLAGVRKIDREKCKCAVETEFFAENSLPTQVRQHFLHMRHDNNKMMAFYPNDRPFRRGTHWVCVSCRAATSPANCVMNCDDASFFCVIFKLIHIPSELMPWLTNNANVRARRRTQQIENMVWLGLFEFGWRRQVYINPWNEPAVYSLHFNQFSYFYVGFFVLSCRCSCLRFARTN